MSKKLLEEIQIGCPGVHGKRDDIAKLPKILSDKFGVSVEQIVIKEAADALVSDALLLDSHRPIIRSVVPGSEFVYITFLNENLSAMEETQLITSTAIIQAVRKHLNLIT